MAVERDELRPQVANLLDKVGYQLTLGPLTNVGRTECLAWTVLAQERSYEARITMTAA